MVQKIFRKASIKYCYGHCEAEQAFLLGQAGAIITDKVWVKHFVQRNRDKVLALENIMGKSSPAGIAVNKGQKTLLDAINIFVSQYNGSAFEAANYKRWLAGEVG